MLMNRLPKMCRKSYDDTIALVKLSYALICSYLFVTSLIYNGSLIHNESQVIGNGAKMRQIIPYSYILSLVILVEDAWLITDWDSLLSTTSPI